MSLGQKIAPHLPFLRRYARALNGTQEHGDAYVRATLEALIAAPDQFPEDVDARLGLYHIFHAIWGSAQLEGTDAASTAGDLAEQIAAQRLARISPQSRQALLLTAMEGFTPEDAAFILNIEASEIDRLVADALAEIEGQTKARVLIIEDEPIIAMDIETIVRDLGHEVTGVAVTRDEAVAEAAANPPTLVLSDIQLADNSSGIDAVQEILTVKQTEGANIGRYDSKGNQESILRGKLRCGECGKSMAIRKKKNHGVVQYWYICPMHEHYNSSYCTKKSIKKEQMEQLVFTLIKKQMQLYVDARQLVADLNRHASSRGKYEIYQEQIKNTEKQIGHYAQMKASLYQDYSEGLLTEADYITVGQDYARKMDDLKIFMASLSRDALKYAPEYTGSEKWAKRVEAFQQQEQLSREMVEAFIDMITVYEDGHTEVAFRNMDELEAVLYQASERRKEDMRYAV